MSSVHNPMQPLHYNSIFLYAEARKNIILLIWGRCGSHILQHASGMLCVKISLFKAYLTHKYSFRNLKVRRHMRDVFEPLGSKPKSIKEGYFLTPFHLFLCMLIFISPLIDCLFELPLVAKHL